MKHDICKMLIEIRNNSIERFVKNIYEVILKKNLDAFKSLDVKKILEITLEPFNLMIDYLDHKIRNHIWNKILKRILNEYTNYMLTLKDISLYELIRKIKIDKKAIIKAFSKFIAENDINDINVFNEFIDFLDCSVEMISLPCLRLKEFNGPNFTFNTVKALLDLRNNLTLEEKMDALEICKDVCLVLAILF